MSKKPGSEWRISIIGEPRINQEGDGTTVFDELVIDNWFHLEQMDTHYWWMRVGDYDIRIRLPEDGGPPKIEVNQDKDPLEELQDLSQELGLYDLPVSRECHGYTLMMLERCPQCGTKDQSHPNTVNVEDPT